MKRRTVVLLFGAVALTVIAALFLMLLLQPRPDPDPELREDEAEAPAELTVELYFANVERDPEAVCDRVFAVERMVPVGMPRVEAALRELVAGPEPEERERGYSSFFSMATASRVRSVHTEGSTVYLDLRDSRQELTGANSSCGSASLLAQLEQTAYANGGYERVIVAFDGEPERFYEWLQIGCAAATALCDPAPFKR